MSWRHRPGDDAGFTLPELLVTVVIVGTIIAAVGATMIGALRSHAEPAKKLGPSNDANLLSSYFVADVQSASVSDTAATTPTGCSYTGPAGAANVLALSWTDNTPLTPVNHSVAYQFHAPAATLTRVACVTGQVPELATVAHHVVSATAAVDTTSGAIGLEVSARSAEAAPADAPFTFRLRAYGRLSGSGNGGGGTGSGVGGLPTGELVGTVTRYGDQAASTGAAPLAGVTVTLSRAGISLARSTTDASGKYYFGTLAAGPYEVVLVAPGHVATAASSLAATVSVVDGQAATQPFKVWVPVGTVSGLVRLTDGTPIAGVAVQISPPGPTGASTSTDGAGRYSFGSLPLGTYQVTVATPPGRVAVSGTTCSAAVTDPTPVVCGDAVFAVATGSVTATVWRDLDINGSGDVPMAGVDVDLSQGATVIATAKTDATGTVTFAGLPAGGYTVREVVSGFTPLTPPTGTVDVTVPAGGTATANFVNRAPCALSAGQPANSISLKGNRTPNNNQKVSVRTDGVCSGTVTVTFAAGAPGPASSVVMTAPSPPTGSGPFTYDAPVPGTPTWSAGTVTATVKSGTTVLGTIQVTVA